MNRKACAFTGPHPSHFSFGNDEGAAACRKLKAVMRSQISLLISYGVTTFYTGMDPGVDQWAASIVLELREVYQGVRLIAVIPSEAQAMKWPEAQRDRYFEIAEQCDEEILLQTSYSSSSVYERNRYLVDNADFLLAVYDGGSKGGTAYTVKYAQKRYRNVIIIHPGTLLVTNAANTFL